MGIFDELLNDPNETYLTDESDMGDEYPEDLDLLDLIESETYDQLKKEKTPITRN